jgi:hypothetical protein
VENIEEKKVSGLRESKDLRMERELQQEREKNKKMVN